MFKKLSIVSSIGASLMTSMVHAAQDASLSIPSGVLTSAGVSASFVAHFALFLSCVLLWTIFWGTALKALLRLPIIAGQIIGGILLGPSGINIREFAIFKEPLTVIDAATGYAYSLMSFDVFVFTLILISSTLTVSYLLWIAGHETDVRDLIKVGLTATAAGILGALLPIGMTVLIVYTMFSFGYTFLQAVGLGLIFAATSVSIPVAMLVSQKKMHLKSSKATLGAAIIDDVFAIILLSLFFVVVQQESVGAGAGVSAVPHHGSLMVSLLYMLIAGVIIFLTGYFMVPRLLQWLERKQYSYMTASVASGMMLLYFAFAELFGGLAGITGAYFIGLFHKMGDEDHHAEKAIAPYVNTFLLPLFLASIGLQLDMHILTAFQWMIVVLLLAVAIISKLLGCWLATGLTNFIAGDNPTQRWTGLETYLFGSSMVARGEVGLVVSTILHGTGLITTEQYTIAVVVIVLTTIATPIMLAIGFSLQEVAPIAHSEQYRKDIGLFEHMDTDQMFNLIVGILEKSGAYKTSAQLSEGCRIVSLEEYQVKIIMCPDRGIVVEGDQAMVQTVLQMVQKAIFEDTKRLLQV